MGFLRSSRKFIFVISTSLIIFISLYAIMMKIDHKVTDVNPVEREEAKKPQINDGTIFTKYWRIKEHDNFNGSIKRMNFIHQIRSQDASNEGRRKLSSRLSDNTDPPESQDFSQCRMSTCFDFSRCQSDGPIKVYIVPSRQVGQEQSNKTSLGESNMIHENILKIIRQSKHFEPDPEKACIFVLEDDTLDRDPLSQSFILNISNLFSSTNLYGMNHLIFNLYSGSWPDYREHDFAGLNFGAAILAKASSSITQHRPGFDISIPLFSYLHPYSDSAQDTKELSINPQRNRSYFLTFKGKRYVFGKGSETRNSIYHLDNKRDILMLTTCRHGKKWRDASDTRCSHDELYYDNYDFKHLMHESTFCLTPRGRRLGSFRYLEALSYGCIPVILSDGWIRPFDELIDWSCASIQFIESFLLQVPDILRDLDSSTTSKLRQNCLNLYDQYFSSTKKIILSTLSVIERRIKNHMKDSTNEKF